MVLGFTELLLGLTLILLFLTSLPGASLLLYVRLRLAGLLFKEVTLAEVELEEDDKWGGEPMLLAIPTSLARLFNSELLGVGNMVSWLSDLMTSLMITDGDWGTNVDDTGDTTEVMKSGGD